MTSPHPDDAWRDPDGVLVRAQRSTVVRPTGWAQLAWANLSDARDMASIIARLGGHPIAIHGVTLEGECTCGRRDCAATGKHPVARGWERAPLDARALDELLMERPDLNLGWRMGEQPDGSMLVAIDVDGARSLLAPLESELGPLPPTLTAASARGLHLIYRLREGKTPPRNRVALAHGVDVRGVGGQIVISPSRHASGARYRWIDARAPEVLP